MNLSVEDLLLRFGASEIAELSDHTNRRDMDATVVGKAIADAEALARGYYNAAGLNAVAFDAATVARMADIAAYRLCEGGATEIREKRYKDALAWFELLIRHPAMVKTDTRPSGAKMVRG